MAFEGMTIALSKGRIMDLTLDLFREAGIPMPVDVDSRKLIVESECGTIRYMIAKPSDVPTYVEYGAADLGIAGKDVLLEAGRDVYELLDLGIGTCKLCVAGLPNTRYFGTVPRVASKYPRIATDYFRSRGQQVEVIKLHGSVELAPLIGLAERIVDIVETGRTLAENGLVVQEEILSISTRLIANRMSFRLKEAWIEDWVSKLRRAIEARKDVGV
jgi:ATP phosphoribosyltransferase